jgi:hypothetical protein
MEARPGKGLVTAELLRLAPTLIGVVVLLPVVVIVSTRLLGSSTDAALARAQALAAFWPAAIFLAVFLVPYFLNLSKENNFTALHLSRGAARLVLFFVVCFVLSLILAPRRETDVVLNIVNFHLFLGTFLFLLATLFILTQALGAAGSTGQAIVTFLGLAMVGTVLYFNPLVESEVVSDPFRDFASHLCIGANPLVVSFQSFLGVDVFHVQSVYQFSALSSYPYRYPAWDTVAGAYFLLGTVMLLGSVLAHFLRVILPKNLMRRRLLLLREERHTRLMDWTESLAKAPAQPVMTAPAPAQTISAGSASILESLFQESAIPLEGPDAPEEPTEADLPAVDEGDVQSQELPVDEPTSPDEEQGSAPEETSHDVEPGESWLLPSGPSPEETSPPIDEENAQEKDAKDSLTPKPGPQSGSRLLGNLLQEFYDEPDEEGEALPMSPPMPDEAAKEPKTETAPDPYVEPETISFEELEARELQLDTDKDAELPSSPEADWEEKGDEDSRPPKPKSKTGILGNLMKELSDEPSDEEGEALTPATEEASPSMPDESAQELKPETSPPHEPYVEPETISFEELEARERQQDPDKDAEPPSSPEADWEEKGAEDGGPPKPAPKPKTGLLGGLLRELSDEPSDEEEGTE